MVIYVVLYTQYLRYNICSAWFLDTVLEYQLVPIAIFVTISA